MGKNLVICQHVQLQQWENMDGLYLGNDVEHQLPMFATLKATSPLNGEHNLAKKQFASNHDGAIGMCI